MVKSVKTIVRVKDYDLSRMKSKLYYCILILVGIFYVLPSGQLMVIAQHISDETGSEDICYYNYLCRYSAGWFDDFGHIFSNISYITCGLLFLLITSIRRQERQEEMKRRQETNPNQDGTCKHFQHFLQTGIPEQYGIYYAMGGALILEGILSACYHVCPVDESFQFDTTFMYIIAVLIYSKVYQFRHPDIAPKAYYVYLIISFMLIFEVIGYYVPPPTATGSFMGMAVFLLFYLTVIGAACYKMLIQGDTNTRVKFSALAMSEKCFYALFFLFNFLLAIGFMCHSWNKTSVISKYLLVIVGANMLFYIVYYVSMKYYYAIKHNNRNEK